MLDKSFEKLLVELKYRPGVYIGKKSLERLSAFINGYMYCYYKHNGGPSDYLPGFQDYIEKKYGIQSTHGWSEIIRFFSTTEEEAFDSFFNLVNEFYNVNY